MINLDASFFDWVWCSTDVQHQLLHTFEIVPDLMSFYLEPFEGRKTQQTENNCIPASIATML